MKTIFYSVLLILLILASGAVASQTLADDSTSTAFDQVLEHYELVRLALSHDTTDGVSDQAKQIESILKELAADWSPAAAGIQVDMAADVRGLLPELSKAATALSDATSLDIARDAFYELSKPLVRWRKAATTTPAAEDRPTVAYCPMAKRSWLQPKGDIGNPYHGQSMLSCGEIVDG